MGDQLAQLFLSFATTAVVVIIFINFKVIENKITNQIITKAEINLDSLSYYYLIRYQHAILIFYFSLKNAQAIMFKILIALL